MKRKWYPDKKIAREFIKLCWMAPSLGSKKSIITVYSKSICYYAHLWSSFMTKLFCNRNSKFVNKILVPILSNARPQPTPPLKLLGRTTLHAYEGKISSVEIVCVFEFLTARLRKRSLKWQNCCSCSCSCCCSCCCSWDFPLHALTWRFIQYS